MELVHSCPGWIPASHQDWSGCLSPTCQPETTAETLYSATPWRDQPTTLGPQCLHGTRFLLTRMVCFQGWTCLSSLQWFSQPESQLTEIWFTSTGSHRTSSKGFLYNITIGVTGLTNSCTVQKLPSVDLWKTPLRYQLGGKTLQIQGAISGCSLFFKRMATRGYRDLGSQKWRYLHQGMQ